MSHEMSDKRIDQSSNFEVHRNTVGVPPNSDLGGFLQCWSDSMYSRYTLSTIPNWEKKTWNKTIHMGVSKNMGTPKSSMFHYKPSILGYPYFWKHPHLSVVDFLFFADGSNDQSALVGRMSRRQLPQTAGGLRAQTRKPLAIVAGVSVRCGPALRQQHLNEAVKRSELPDFNGTTIESTS